jgi:hypothetical protein
MIRFRNRGAVFGECWFDEQPPPSCDVDIVALRQRAAPVAGAQCTTGLTLVSDLTVEPEAIFAAYGKNCRQKIQRADARDDLSYEFAPDVRTRLEDFCKFYDAFASHKALRPADRDWLLGARDAGRFTLAAASRGGEALVWHGYVVGADTARMQFSASFFRDQQSVDRAVTARANRWLHWRTMLSFRSIGIARYDWGGLFEDESTPERAGINRFKNEFRGQPIRTFDCLIAQTARGHLRLGIRRLGDAYRSACERVRRAPPTVSGPVRADEPADGEGRAAP